MKISCPKCNACGTIPDHEIPESGRFINCPRCNEGFSVTKPRSGDDAYLVDTCPSCGFSTFGDESFSTCPACGVVVKIFVERQREEQLLKHNQELLGKRANNSETASTSPDVVAPSVTDFIDNLHPVNLIGWGIATAALIVLCAGLLGITGYDGTKIQALILQETGEQLSGFSIFVRYGLMHWVKLLYGLSALIISLLFLKRLKIALRALSALIWITIALVPLSYIISFVYWVLAPISHTFSGYFIEIINIIFMSVLVGVPLYILERYLYERKITSVVKL